MVFTGPIEDGAIDSVRKPIPINAIASRGLPAISPHRLMGVFVASHCSIMLLRKFKPAGESGSNLSESFGLPRSLANKN